MINEEHQNEENCSSAIRKKECETTQSDYTTPPSPPILPELNDDLLINIFSYLPYTDLTQTRLVCRRWMECVAFKRFARKFCLCIKEDNEQDLCKQLQTGYFASGMCYRHMTYMGTADDAAQLDNLKCILHKIGHHILSLKLGVLFPNNSLYALFPNLERLTFEDLSNLATVLPFELNTFPNLKGLDFVDDFIRSSVALTTACLRKNTKVKLEELSIRVYAEHVELFSQVLRDHAPTLKSLHAVYFDGPTNEHDEIVEKWRESFEHLKKLEKLKIYASDALIFEGALRSFKGMPFLPLRYLEVDCLKPINPLLLHPLAKYANLEHLAFLNYYFPKSCLSTSIISECFKGLKKLILINTRMLDENELCNIACTLLNLEVLILRYCKKGVTNKSVAAIFQNLTELRELDLSGNKDFDVKPLRGTRQRPNAIQRLRRLEKLNLESCQQLTTDEVLATLKFPFLRSLKFGRGIYTDEGINVLVRQCPLLEELTITFCPRLGQSALLCIAKSLPRLRLLHFLHCPQVDNSVRLILCAECPLLRDLKISDKSKNAKPSNDLRMESRSRVPM